MKRNRCIKKTFRIFIMLISLLILPPLGLAQREEKIRVAIIDFTKESQVPEFENLEKIVPEWLTTFLVETQAFELIERRELKKVLQEQNLGQTGIIEAESAAELQWDLEFSLEETKAMTIEVDEIIFR